MQEERSEGFCYRNNQIIFDLFGYITKATERLTQRERIKTRKELVETKTATRRVGVGFRLPYV